VSALLDVNFLFALFDARHDRHGDAVSWFEANANQGWATCALTENGFARIASRQGYAHGIDVPTAARLLRSASGHSDHEYWPCHVSLRNWLIIDSTRISGPSQITDVYLLALAVARDGQLVTFDRRINTAAVIGFEPRHLLVL